MSQLHLAVALDGAGWHPAAWRHLSARPSELFTARYWSDLAATAERGLLDLVTIEDSFGLQSSAWNAPDGRTDQVRGRLDALLVASLIGPRTTHLGIVPTATVTHSEPFHIASATSTLDYVTGGRGGWRPQVSARPSEARHLGLRELPEIDPTRLAGGIDQLDPATAQVIADLFDEAADVVEVVRRLWDSWEDGAITKDVATGRFIDRERLHYIDFEGPHFAVKGPSIVPRPPQGQPLVAALAHGRVPFELAAKQADVVFVTPDGGFLADDSPAGWVAGVRAAEQAVGRAEWFPDPLQVWGDLVVVLDESAVAARTRLAQLDQIDGGEFRSDTRIFAGTPAELADLLDDWASQGIQGFRLRPGVLTHDLDQIVDGLVPILQARGQFRRAYSESTLRSRLGLARPASRYASTAA